MKYLLRLKKLSMLKNNQKVRQKTFLNDNVALSMVR